MPLPINLYQADQLRRLDKLALAESNLDGFTLMERAGRAAWKCLRSNWPAAVRLRVVCGGGNNGGDGYILAGLAMGSGMDVGVLYVGDPDKLTGDARRAYLQYTARTGARCGEFSVGEVYAADVVADALLGTGITREVSGAYLQAINNINRSGRPVLALDIPSGLHADTGAVLGVSICADVTISFVGLKPGLFTGQGRNYCGRIEFSDLDIPDTVYSRVAPVAVRLDYATQSRMLRRRDRSAHKGHYGHVLVIGGDYGYAGAALMAAQAAARVGAGLVSLATRPDHVLAMAAAVPEIMARGIDRPAELHPLLEKATVVAVGPGLGRSEWSSRLLAHALESKLPIIADADALYFIAKEPFDSKRWVLTPHPGEAAMLLGTTTADITADRLANANRIQERYGGVCVLKGSGTLVADGAMLHLCSDGNPGMASGGMGDVLTGTIAALAAQGLGLADAAKVGVCLHGAAADAAAAAGERGMLATDLMPWLRKLANP
jgi:NAD(P)H-hydrate epimerase